MAILRNRSHLSISAPPPSPIPTATGSRSAANEILSEYLENKLNVPELALPEPHFSATTVSTHRTADEISLRSLVLREPDSVDRLQQSAREIGVFRIKFHGILEEELRSLSKEAERVFKILEKRDTGDGRDIGGRNSNKEEIIWVRSGKERMDWAREYIGAELYLIFSEKMEIVASKLDTIAEQLGQVFMELLGKQSGRTQEGQSVLSIYKYNHNNTEQQTSPLSCKDENNISFDHHILSLHLAIEQCKYCVQLGQTHLSFDASPAVIVVTIGKQLEEWSLGKFKCVSGEMIYRPDSQRSFSIELKCSSFDFKPSLYRTLKTISFADQILIFVIVTLICKFLWL